MCNYLIWFELPRSLAFLSLQKACKWLLQAFLRHLWIIHFLWWCSENWHIITLVVCFWLYRDQCFTCNSINIIQSLKVVPQQVLLCLQNKPHHFFYFSVMLIRRCHSLFHHFPLSHMDSVLFPQLTPHTCSHSPDSAHLRSLTCNPATPAPSVARLLYLYPLVSRAWYPGWPYFYVKKEDTTSGYLFTQRCLIALLFINFIKKNLSISTCLMVPWKTIKTGHFH